MRGTSIVWHCKNLKLSYKDKSFKTKIKTNTQTDMMSLQHSATTQTHFIQEQSRKKGAVQTA